LSIKRVIISGGGTGGHIYPAIAIASALKEIDPQIEFLFVGAEGKMEMEKVPKAGFKIIGLPIVGINREHPLKNLLFPFKLAKSLQKAFQILADFNPDVAIGVGGYASGPVLLAAWVKGIPFYIQEQNSYAGITNKVLSSKAQHIFVAYPGMERFFNVDKLTLSGNPVRKDLIDISSKKAAAQKLFGLLADRPTILIIGGSQGARSINQAILHNLEALAAANVQIVWQTGISFESEAKAACEKYPNLAAYVSAFIYEMDLAYAMADLVISRAGALSVSEICLAGKPSILVPFPNAAEDHQTENARSLVQENAAILIKDHQAQKDLIPTALKILTDKPLLTILAENSFGMGKPKAAQEIAEYILNNTICA
jgi:UDP-N-acetylglucosamine--N-acetylmuramyl-(pentapeptide) pyrophosphoryl-undecaprenol N-acetylglucosamine transferase